MNRNFLNLLINPESGKNFIFDSIEKKLICSDTQTRYEVIDDIPIILNTKPKEVNDEVILHERYQTHFNYKEHYQIDSVEYNYFEAFESDASNHENRRLHEAIFSNLNKNHQIILDVGCGGGWVAKHALRKGKTVISMDVSTNNPIKVKKLFPSKNHFALVADVYFLPIKNNSIDFIVASEIMEHVINPQKFVEILYSKLKPGGKLIITTPYNEKLEYNLCVHCNRPTPRHAHLHSFNENNIKNLIPTGSNWKYSKFCNKILVKIYSHIVLKYFSFGIWFFIDKLANKIFSKSLRLMIEIKKL